MLTECFVVVYEDDVDAYPVRELLLVAGRLQVRTCKQQSSALWR
jgi:hypothetical protein